MKLYNVCFIHSLKLISFIIGFILVFQVMNSLYVSKVESKVNNEYISILNYNKTVSINYEANKLLKSTYFRNEHSLVSKSFETKNSLINKLLKITRSSLDLINNDDDKTLVSIKMVEFIENYQSQSFGLYYKKAQLYFIVYVFMMFNIMYLSYHLANKMSFNGKYFGENFLHQNFYFSIGILVSIILLNLFTANLR